MPTCAFPRLKWITLTFVVGGALCAVAAADAKDSSLKPGIIRYPDGTIVRRNPDGSIETMDDNPIVVKWGSAATGSGSGSARPKRARKAAASTAPSKTTTKKAAPAGSSH